MTTYTVTIQDLRPNLEGKRYERVFEADTAEQAKDAAAAILRKTDGLFEGADFHIASCKETETNDSFSWASAR